MRNQLRCNPFRVLGGVIGIGLVLVIIPMLFTPGTYADQRKLTRLVQKMTVMQAQCPDTELAELLGYTCHTYDTINRFNVRILSLNCVDAAGINWPIVPGLSLDRWTWDNLPDEFLIGLMLHEAMHDHLPYFGHAHMKHLVPVDTNKNKYEDLVDELNKS